MTSDDRTAGGLIVFGDDGSSHADRAWLWINNQPWPGWSADVVTAYPDGRDRWIEEEPIRLEQWEPSSPRQPFGECGLGSVRHLRSRADPRIVLGSCTQADLIVVGPTGARGMKHLFLGSTVDHLLHNPPAPLAIATTPRPASRILVCTDGSPGAQHAVEVFSRLPLAAAAEHVAVLGVATVGIYDDRTEVFGGVETACRQLDALSPEAIRVESTSSVAGAIVDHLFAMRAQLVVVGTRGLTGLRRVVLGSTANAVVRGAPCSALVVPAPPRPA